jgi:hypothetical protein
MSKGIIIAAFATCGKTYLGNKYSNVIDLESSKYKYINVPDKTIEQLKGTIGKINPKWPNNYYKAIMKAQEEYDVVLIQLKPEHFDYLDKNNIKYSIAYPNLNNWGEVEKRCIARNNNKNFIIRLKKVFVPFYMDSISRKYEKIYILDNEMTLEDCLLKDNIHLKKY